MVSLYFNVFSSLSLSNLLPRVQLASLLNNQNSNSLLNRFGIQDTVTDLLNRVGFDQTFSIGNKIGIDRPDSVLQKLELGMNNVINLNQQGLLNPGPSGGLYGGNGPGQYPAAGGGGISGTGSYGGQAGVSGVPTPLGGQGSWQGQTQGSFPIGGGGNRPGPGGYPPGGGQFSGGLQDGGGGVNQEFGNGAEGQAGNSGGGGMLSGLLSQMGNRFGWGSSANKNEPKDYYKQAGELSPSEASSEWWMNQEDSHEYWLEESLHDVLEPGRTTENHPDVVLKYLVESQIKKLIATLLQHLAEAKVKPEEQVKMNEAAETELRKLTPDQIKRIAHDIVEREKSKMNRLNRYKDRTEASQRPTNILSEDDLKRLLVESTKRKDILPDRAEIVRLLETAQLFRGKERNQAAPDVNKTTMSQVIEQLTNSKPKPTSARLENNVPANNNATNNGTSGDRLNVTTSIDNDQNGSDGKRLVDKQGQSDVKLETIKVDDATKTLPTDSKDTNRPKLYISEQMRNNINELLQQLTLGNERTSEEYKTSSKQVNSAEQNVSTPQITTIGSTTHKTTVKPTIKTDVIPTPNPINDTYKVVENSNADDDDVKLLLQRLFGNVHDETLQPILPQHQENSVPKSRGRKNLSKNTLESNGGESSFRHWIEKRMSSEKLVPNARKVDDSALYVSVTGAASTKMKGNMEDVDPADEQTARRATALKSITRKDGAFNNLTMENASTSEVSTKNPKSKRRELFLEQPMASRWFRRSPHKKVDKSSLKY